MTRLALLTAASALATGSALADAFNRIASFPVTLNMAEGADTARESSPEIIAAFADGETLVYTDSPLGVLGYIDITDPADPQPLGNVELDGEPTSVVAVGRAAIVGVNTSESFTDPSGFVASFTDMGATETDRCALPGQPDALAAHPDGSFVAIAIENERDEDAGDGRVPQMPPGSLVTVGLTGEGLLDCDTLAEIDLTGLAEVAPEDPEPEYVHVNAEGEIVVTLQENNHLVVVRDGAVVSHFSAGAVDLSGIDASDDGALSFDEAQEGVVREPDAAAWIDDTHFATANEGDMDGGSRGWTIFSQDGEVVYDSGTSFEHAIVEIGHYPDARSDSKGVEPESVTFAAFDGMPMLFVGSERGSVVGVYDVSDPSNPQLSQLLPSGVGPEGYAAIPSRNLLVSANEADLIEDGGARAHVMLFEFGEGGASYPHITSAGSGELIGWGALSALFAEGTTLYAVNDSFYGFEPAIFTVDASQTPARITEKTVVTREGRPAQKLDLEGITGDGAGGFWLASEGRADRLIPHAILRVDAEGEIQEEVGLPQALLAVQDRYGFEGIAMVDGVLWMPTQREWADDPENMVKLVSYDPETEAWGAVHYPKSEAETGWVGLSEIAAHGDHVYLIERDNQLGRDAAVKKITRVAVSELQPAPLDGELPVVGVEDVRDLLPDLRATGGYVVDKVEGLAIAEDGTAWVVTDNDGVDDSSGETLFFSFEVE